MVRIVRVGALDGNTVDVELDNGNILLLNMELLSDSPAFAELLEDSSLFLHPQTDGESLFWSNGSKLGLAEIFNVIQKNNVNRMGEY